MKSYIRQKNTLENKNGGFTLIETLIAVFILTLALNGLFTLIANSLFAARYTKNELTANYLLQEAVDSIRNDRDTIAFQNLSAQSWTNFVNKYSSCNGQFNSVNGCYIEPGDPSTVPQTCSVSPGFGTLQCPPLYYDETAQAQEFYNYKTLGVKSNFKRQVIMLNRGGDEVDFKVTVEWLNGGLVQSRSIVISLFNWQQYN
jgi:Tfp pilus assembly protein PilV